MEYFFFPDVYADRYLIDFYVVSFKLRDKSCVITKEWEGMEYIVKILDWEAFKNSAYDIVLYEYGDEIGRFSDIELALLEAYKKSYIEARRHMPQNIEPALGMGNPPIEVLERVLPFEYKPEAFPQNLDNYLEELVKKVEVETTEWEQIDDDEAAF